MTIFKVLCGWENMLQEAFPTIWFTMWIKSDDRGWCHDLNLGAIWIGADSEIMLSWPNLMCVWIGKKITGSFHDQFEVICELDQVIDDDAMT
jgi:hypothetical protein